ISESGRALTAHHALLLINVIDLEAQLPDVPEEVTDDDHPIVHELLETYRAIDARSLREVYHDTSFAKDQVQSHFNTGVISLRERAMAERLILAIMNRVAHLADRDEEEFEDILPEISGTLIDRYFCNFSLF